MKRYLQIFVCLVPLIGLGACGEIHDWAEKDPYVFDPIDPDYYVVPNNNVVVVVEGELQHQDSSAYGLGHSSIIADDTFYTNN